jgi:hypothetical protein
MCFIMDTVNASRIAKIAGLSLTGVVVASIAADKANLGPVASQIAGFAGAFVGSLVASRRKSQETPAQPPDKDEDGGGSQP